MAVTYGTWEYANGNGMAVGMQVTWSAVTTSSTTVTATYLIYTDNQYTYADNNEKITFSVKNGGTTLDSGSFLYNNTTAGTPVLRATKTYVHTYTTG